MGADDSGKESLRERMARRLIGLSADVPLGKIRRLGRTAASAARGARLLSADGEIDEEAIAKWVTSIGEMKGVAMKVGQIMSYVDVALPASIREALSALQTHSAAMPIDEVRGIIAQELGAEAPGLLATLADTPIAAASIGQVHRATLPDGREVAVKVQYPGIERAMADDFGVAAIGPKMAGLLFPAADLASIFDELKTRLLEECDYEHEAAWQTRFGDLFREHPIISVPSVHERWSSRRVLTTNFVHGVSLDTFLSTRPSQETRDTIGRALFEFYVGSLFRHGVFNCDPHPGNYLVRDDSTLAVLDYGSCRAFSPAFVDKAKSLTLAVHEDSREALHQAFIELEMVDEGRRYDFDTARGLVRSFYGPMLTDAVQAIDLGSGIGMQQAFQRKQQMLQLRLPPEFVFLFRIRFGLMSVLAQIGTEANWYRLEREMIGDGR